MLAILQHKVCLGKQEHSMIECSGCYAKYTLTHRSPSHGVTYLQGSLSRLTEKSTGWLSLARL